MKGGKILWRKERFRIFVIFKIVVTLKTWTFVTFEIWTFVTVTCWSTQVTSAEVADFCSSPCEKEAVRQACSDDFVRVVDAREDV